MSHIFISYSHQDRDYAHKLEGALLQRRFDVWIDDRINYGSQWPQVIQDQLDACAALILVMSPRSWSSTWVQNELARAQAKGKPILPLLLDGDNWLSVQAIQHVDARGGKLPPEWFYEDLRTVVSTLSPPFSEGPSTPRGSTRWRSVWRWRAWVLAALVGVVGLVVLGPRVLEWRYWSNPPVTPTVPLFSTLETAPAPGDEVIATPTATVMPMPSATPTPLPTAAPTVTATTMPTLTETPTSSFTPTPSATPTPFLRVYKEQLIVYKEPSEQSDRLDTIYQGELFPLLGRTRDAAWWAINRLGKLGWIHAQPAGASVVPETLPVLKVAPTPTAEPTLTPQSTTPPGPAPISLQNPGFANVIESSDPRQRGLPGWDWQPEVNYVPGQKIDPQTTFITPTLKQADEEIRRIDGATLQIDGASFTRFKVYIFQTVDVEQDTVLRFSVLARAYNDKNYALHVAAGVDPMGRHNCGLARWLAPIPITEQDGVKGLVAPDVVVTDSRRATVCLFAEAPFATNRSAVFFDSAELIENPN